MMFPFWWLDRPVGVISFTMVFLVVGLVIVDLFLLMIYLIRLVSEKRFGKPNETQIKKK